MRCESEQNIKTRNGKKGSHPSVKVPSISMENDGVLERAKMGISINGEKEWKKTGDW